MIKIEVWSDVNCPFCYIGKRHLENALKKFLKNKLVKIEVEWKSFELDPNTNPPKGADNTERLALKYGKDRAWAEQMNQNMTKMARSAGLDFHLDKVIPANSFNAHRLIHLAKLHGLQNQMKEKLLSFKFIEGKDISAPNVLREAAVSIGLDHQEVQTVLESDQFAQDVRHDEEQAGALGIRGVPFFIFNKEHSISGAQPEEVFLAMLEDLSDFQVAKNLE
ncbi:MAG: DsbA family oxidoreductase [Bacteriovorax sp.]|nr:DsbA family oxidoreductase [Bacteriovorax sp.]